MAEAKDMTTEARERLNRCLDQLGPSRAVLTRGMVEAQVAAAEWQFMEKVALNVPDLHGTEFTAALKVWLDERDKILAARFPEWFKARERKEAGLFGGTR